LKTRTIGTVNGRIKSNTQEQTIPNNAARKREIGQAEQEE
jgi:hypothetical protein